MMPVASAVLGGVGLSLVVAAAVPEPAPDRRKLEAIEMNAAGDAGVLHTVAEVLGEEGAAYHFGAPHCRGKTLGPTMLEQLHVALRTGQLLTIGATEHARTGGDPIRCVQTVTFWGPKT